MDNEGKPWEEYLQWCPPAMLWHQPWLMLHGRLLLASASFRDFSAPTVLKQLIVKNAGIHDFCWMDSASPTLPGENDFLYYQGVTQNKSKFSKGNM